MKFKCVKTCTFKGDYIPEGTVKDISGKDLDHPAVKAHFECLEPDQKQQKKG